MNEGILWNLLDRGDGGVTSYEGHWSRFVGRLTKDGVINIFVVYEGLKTKLLINTILSVTTLRVLSRKIVTIF